MRSIAGIVVFALMSFAGLGLAAADEVKITDGYFKYGGVKYFRGKAEEVDLASYGEKKTPWAATNYLSVQGTIAREDLAAHGKVRKISPVDIDWSKHRERDVAANFGFKYFTLGGKAAVTGSYAKFKSANLKLVKFVIDEESMINVLNHTDRARNYLKREGRDGRVVVALWVAMEGALAEEFRRSTNVTISAKGNAGAIEITADMSGTSTSSGSHTITLARGAHFAYLLSRVKEWNKDKTAVRDMEDDSVGMN